MLFSFVRNIFKVFYLLIAAMPHLIDDRTPLMAPFLNSAMPPESIANFYSPYDSCHNSDEEDDQVSIDQKPIFIWFKEIELVTFKTRHTKLQLASYHFI